MAESARGKTACAKTGYEPSDAAKYQWNFEREREKGGEGKGCVRNFSRA